MRKYLPFYKACISTGRMPHAGLCKCVGIDDMLFSIFFPPNSPGFWGYWSDVGDNIILSQDVEGDLYDDLLYKFTPLRQNIVLLMAAMNGEL